MHILIVEHDSGERQRLTALVDAIAGAKSVSVSDGADALDWCQYNRVDLTVADCDLPEPGGPAFIRSFRSLPGYANVPLVMLTSREDGDRRHEILLAGANDFLDKPVDEIEFRARVANLLELRRVHHRLADHTGWLAAEVRKATAELENSRREALFVLTKTAEYRDNETGAHIRRIAHYSRLLAGNLGCDQATCDLVFEASPMHDVGKVGIPDDILLKPGRLDPDEYAVMCRHTQIGYEILRSGRSPLLQAAARIALMHHEKFDGSGYPQGLRGRQIDQLARIVSVVDVYDALTSERPYKQPWETDRALGLLLRERGRHFDPDCVDAFLMDVDAIVAIGDEIREERETPPATVR